MKKAGNVNVGHVFATRQNSSTEAKQKIKEGDVMPQTASDI